MFSSVKQELYLNGIKMLGDEQAEALSHSDAELWLNGVVSITDYQATNLGKLEKINLASLRELTDQQASSLAYSLETYDNDSLKKYLKLGVTSITNKQAEAFALISHLWLDSLISLSDSQSQSLSKVPNLSLLGLESINKNQAASLSRVKTLFVSDAIRTQINTFRRLRDGISNR
ncbi:MAG: hypothetical protein CMJ76_11600 [Planctomycetaceae bacterium]|nr:hypothetical protein [Planctomycetaceae bacterium]